MIVHEWLGIPRAICSHLINDFLFEYPYNAQILWHRWLWMGIEKEYSLFIWDVLCMNGYGCLEQHALIS